MYSPLSISTFSAVKKPLISVLLPVYNGGEYLKESLHSVLAQQDVDFELLIIDDCSTDGSFDFLKGLRDERIVLFHNTVNKGLFYNLNFLISQAKSALIKLWAQDDIMYHHCLQTFVHFHEQHPLVGFSYSGRDMIDETGNIKPNGGVDHTPEIISTELHARIAYYTGSIAGNIANVCISSKALQKVGLFNEQMKISADFDLWVRIAEHFEVGFIRQKLIKLRDHAGQLSRNEKYYLNHVKEDITVFQYLNSYVDDKLQKEGKSLLRRYKLQFYYTLMLKCILTRNFALANAYASELSKMDNLFSLSLSYFKTRMMQAKKPPFILQFTHA